MATTDYGVTVAQVLAKLPIDASQISATTKPLSTTDVEGYIDDADSQMSGVLKKGGLDLDDLNDDTKRQVQEAVKAYAIAMCLDSMGAVGQQYDKYYRRWQETYQRYGNRPQLLTQRITRIKHNVDTSTNAKTAGFIGRTYEF